MKLERAKKLRAASSLLAISLVVVATAGVVLTGVLSAFEQMTWAVGLFITLKVLIAMLLGGVLGLVLGLLVRRKQGVLSVLFGVILVELFMFVHIRVFNLLSVYTPAMSGIVAPIAESLPHVGFLVGLVVGLCYFTAARGKNDSAGKSGV